MAVFVNMYRLSWSISNFSQLGHCHLQIWGCWCCAHVFLSLVQILVFFASLILGILWRCLKIWGLPVLLFFPVWTSRSDFFRLTATFSFSYIRLGIRIHFSSTPIFHLHKPRSLFCGRVTTIDFAHSSGRFSSVCLKLCYFSWYSVRAATFFRFKFIFYMNFLHFHNWSLIVLGFCFGKISLTLVNSAFTLVSVFLNSPWQYQSSSL